MRLQRHAVDVNTRMLAITVIDELWFTVTMLMIDKLLSGVRCISYVCVSLDSGCVIYCINSWCVSVIERACSEWAVASVRVGTGSLGQQIWARSGHESVCQMPDGACWGFRMCIFCLSVCPLTGLGLVTRSDISSSRKEWNCWPGSDSGLRRSVQTVVCK